MYTKIVNSTQHDLIFKEGYGDILRTIKLIPSMKAYRTEFYEQKTYREYLLSTGNQHIIITDDDLIAHAEITVYETPSQKTEWRGSKRRHSVEDSAAFDAVKKDASSRMEIVEKFHARLLMLSKQVKICPAQCQNLVQICLQGVENMKDAYIDIEKSEHDMWQLYISNKLGQLISSLDNLLSTLGSIQDLLQACGINWCSMTLAVSLPLPPPERMSSKFDTLSKELHWNLETIQYALHLNEDRLALNWDEDRVAYKWHDDHVEFKWNERKIRFVLYRPEVTVREDTELEQSGRLASADRKDLLSQLENGSILVPGNPGLLSSLWWHLGFKFATDHWRDKLAAELQKRLQETAVLSNNYSSIPDCFWIDVADLKFLHSLCGDQDASKSVWKGEWCGQPVAIGTTKNTTKAAVEKEARLMLKVQHPNIVGFLGCAFISDAPPQLRSEKDEKCSAGYLVMELMQEDLRHLIDRRARSQIGNPFTLAVTVDILSQIASAMVHMHNLDIMHRDLKSANCLVNTRSPSNSSSQVCKLIDFELSKELDPDTPISNHTLKSGTVRWMAPEVWGVQISDANSSAWPQGPYTRFADVWSFGMTCYEVITGKDPFHEYSKNRDIEKVLREGKRPVIPASVSCPEGLKTLMSRCWTQEPSDRPDFKDIEKELWTIKYELEIQ